MDTRSNPDRAPAPEGARPRLAAARRQLGSASAALSRRLPPGLRTLAGLGLATGGLFGFLPVLGFWMLPLGLLLIGADVAALARTLSPRRPPRAPTEAPAHRPPQAANRAGTRPATAGTTGRARTGTGRDTPIRGRIAAIDPVAGRGQIEATDDRMISFHRAAVVEGDFDALRPRDTVELAVRTGESGAGPQACTVRPVGPANDDPS